MHSLADQKVPGSILRSGEIFFGQASTRVPAASKEYMGAFIVKQRQRGGQVLASIPQMLWGLEI